MVSEDERTRFAPSTARNCARRPVQHTRVRPVCAACRIRTYLTYVACMYNSMLSMHYVLYQRAQITMCVLSI